MIDSDNNLWRASSRESAAFETLDRDLTVDLVVIGGGYTGCSTALHSSMAGMKTCLLEAERMGHGGSGRNVGLVNAGLWLPPETINRTLGEEQGELLTAVLSEAPDLVFNLIEQLGIDCEPVRTGTLHCAHSRKGMADLADRQRQLSARGVSVSLLSEKDTAARTGAKTFYGALHDPRAGTIHPLSYCRGLASAAEAAGALLFERSGVTRITQTGNSWLVETRSGSVRAQHLLLATNGYHAPISNLNSPEYVPFAYFQMATAPLSHNLRHSILPNREGCWDTALIMSSFRTDNEGRLIIGGIGSLDALGGAVHQTWARRKLTSLFPQLENVAFEYAWFGRIALTGDHLPKVVRLGENGFSVFGYSGRGIGPGTAFGKAAASVFSGNGETAFPLRPRDDHAEPFQTARQQFYEFGATLVHSFR